MLYPSIQELLKKTEKNGEESLNKYSLVMATAKCARVITNEYLKERAIAERKIANKETDTKDITALITKRYRDEKAVKNAVKELKEGEFEVFVPGEEGYESSIVDVVEYEDIAKEETRSYKIKPVKVEQVADDEDFDDFDDEEADEEELDEEEYLDDEENISELMGSNTVLGNRNEIPDDNDDDDYDEEASSYFGDQGKYCKYCGSYMHDGKCKNPECETVRTLKELESDE